MPDLMALCGGHSRSRWIAGARRGLLVLAVGLAGPLAGCKTWHIATESPERLIAERRPAAVRVTGADGAATVLRSPMIAGDSLVTPAVFAPGGNFALPRSGVAVADIRAVEVERFSAWRTVGLAAGIVAASVLWARIAGDTHGGEPLPDDPLPKGPGAGVRAGVPQGGIVIWRWAGGWRWR